METVEEELRKDPEISNEELRSKAEDIDPEFADLSARQFNARYPLQVKRQLEAEQKEKKPTPSRLTRRWRLTGTSFAPLPGRCCSTSRGQWRALGAGRR